MHLEAEAHPYINENLSHAFSLALELEFNSIGSHSTMKLFQVTLLVFVSMLGTGLCAEGQLPSSSSGLVFPGPPRRKSGEPEVGALQRPRPVYSVCSN